MTTSRMMMIVVAVRATVVTPPTSSSFDLPRGRGRLLRLAATHRVHGAGETCEVDAHAGGDVAHLGPRERFANGGAVGVLGGNLLGHRRRKLLRRDDVLLVGERRATCREKRENEGERRACGRHRKTSSHVVELDTSNRDTGSLNSAVPVTALQNWLASLEKRHLADLTFSEVSRALRALSSTYVERRSTIASGAALSGAGKRAAFALFYGPLHFLLLDAIARALPVDGDHARLIIDLGCGTGAAGAALANVSGVRRVIGIDRSQWALDEARSTYRDFGLTPILHRGDVTTRRLPPDRAIFLAAFVMNELSDVQRDDLLTRLLDRATRGDRVLIVEPIAGFVARWWNPWRDRIQGAGGRADEWRFRVDLPPIVSKLDRAAGLNHKELTARTFWL